MPNAAFTALLTDVYSITNRADLVAETTLAVRAATLKLHQSDFYPKDLSEARVQFSAAAYFQSLAYRSLFPYFRAISYVRKYESGAPTGALKVIEPTNIFDSYNIAKEDVCYLAGAVIQIRSRTEIQDILFGYYQNPVTDPETYESWIDTNYHYAIVVEAASTVFKMIGFDEQTAMYKQIAAEWAMQVRNSNILAEGY